MAPGAAGTTINRVRLRSAAGDPLAARLRAARLLAGVAQAAPIAPAAILCVKRLRDPRPGSLCLASAHAPPHQWTRAVDEALSSLARAAARPARGTPAGDPDAVLFDDRAEMLACLAADWCRGAMPARWWWRALLGEAPGPEAVVRAWRERPEHIAAAVEVLATLGAAADFARRLPRAHVRLLLDAVLATHGLADLAAAVGTAVPTRDEAWTGPGAPTPVGTAAALDRRASDAGAARAPWTTLAPEAREPALRADQALLLGVTLTLRRRAAVARSADFAAETLAWRAATVHADARQPGAAPAADPPGSGATTARSDMAATGVPPVPGALTPESPGGDSTPVTAWPVPAPGVVAAAGTRAQTGATPHALPATRPLPDVRTGLGGLFYLLNVAIALGYYGDFTAPAHRGLALSIWDFVALVGQALVPDEPGDPLWALLAALAGRDPDVAPGAGVDPPDGWTSWTARLVPRVRARLARAFGMEDTAAMGRLVCGHAARVLVTATHVDVRFPLADLPIAIRMSGLDRDPGWIPAADRIVTFHFD